MHISLYGETLFYIGFFPVTSTILSTWVIMCFLIFFVLFFKTTYKFVPSYVQVVLEAVIGGIYSLFKSVVGEKVSKFFPYLATFFIFIIVCNWFGLLPGVGTITIDHEVHGKITEVPIFRAPTADLNTTLALAFISFILLHYYGIKTLGGKIYFSKFINFKSPIDFMTGILEIVSELGKILSFSFRLFGNIFAGEVLLVVIAFLIPVIVPLPFVALELFVGFIQALVFSMLTAVFLQTATAHESH
jgi:F-type H+-transporting ATPase subunit a